MTLASLERLQSLNIDKTELHRAQKLEKIEDREFDLNALEPARDRCAMSSPSKRMLATIQNQRDNFLAISKPKALKIHIRKLILPISGTSNQLSVTVPPRFLSSKVSF